MDGSDGPTRKASGDLFLRIEHLMYVTLGVVLAVTAAIAMAGAVYVLYQGISNWTHAEAIFSVIDRLLFVLMLIEILHTVRVSVRSGTLNAEPFLIVGLIASIRRILVITLETTGVGRGEGPVGSSEQSFSASMVELSVLGGLIIVMVVSIVLLRRFRLSVGED